MNEAVRAATHKRLEQLQHSESMAFIEPAGGIDAALKEADESPMHCEKCGKLVGYAAPLTASGGRTLWMMQPLPNDCKPCLVRAEDAIEAAREALPKVIAEREAEEARQAEENAK